MFEILAYLVERYFDLGDYPGRETLSRQLAAAGFQPGDIHQALDWLSELEESTTQPLPGGAARRATNPCGLRLYAEDEQRKIGREARGFLQFLETAGVLDACDREVVIDRMMALTDEYVGLEQAKLIVLIVLWNQGQRLDSLVFDELRTPERPGLLH